MKDPIGRVDTVPVRRAGVTLLLAVVVLAGSTACGSDSDPTADATPTAEPSATPAATPTAGEAPDGDGDGDGDSDDGSDVTPVDEPTSTPTEEPEPSPTVVPAYEIDVEVVGGAVTGGGRHQVPLGEEVTVRVTSDVADHVHVHGYDLFGDVAAGGTVEVTFVADLPGVWEVELEDRGLLLVELEVS